VTEQAIDASTPSGRFLFHVLGAISQWGVGYGRCSRSQASVSASVSRGSRLA